MADRPLAVGVYAHSLHVPSHMRNNVSGHAQLAMKAAECLHEAGCDVQLLTTRNDPDRVDLPVTYPAGVPLETIDIQLQRRVSADGSEYVLRKGGANGVAAIKLMRSVSAVARDRRLDVVHTFGSPRSAMLAIRATALGRRGLSAATLVHPIETAPDRRLMSQVGAIFSSNSLTIDSLPSHWTNVSRVRHGLTKALLAPDAAARRQRVVFWREATHTAGADLVVEAFDRLAVEYPQFSFDFLIRSTTAHEVGGLDGVADRRPNVNLFRFPYQPPISLELALSEAACVVLPFRRTTFNPQLAVLESILAGAPTITTRVGSNDEMWPGENPNLLDSTPTVGAICEAIRSCLDHPESAVAEARDHAAWTASRWNWARFGEETVSAYRAQMRPTAAPTQAPSHT